MTEVDNREDFRTRVILEEFSPDQLPYLSIEPPFFSREGFRTRFFNRIKQILKENSPIIILSTAAVVGWGSCSVLVFRDSPLASILVTLGMGTAGVLHGSLIKLEKYIEEN